MSGYIEDLTAAVNDAWSEDTATLDASTEYGDLHDELSAALAESARPRRQNPD